MSLIERIEKMDPKEIASRPEVKDLWNRGLFWSLSHRRSFRYPLGVSLPKDDFYDYEPRGQPVPLSEVELALLCWAAAGTNGLNRNDLTFAQSAVTILSFEGRVYPSGCSVWYAHLIFSTDDGIFYYRPHVPSKPVEVETQEDMEVIFKAFKEGVIQLSDQPIRVTEQSRALSHINIPIAFKPGTANFFAIVDLTTEYINLAIAHAWRSRTRFIDDEPGQPPRSAGLQKWVDSGYLNGLAVPLSQADPRSLMILAAHAHYMQQNLLLCATAMGLGGFPYGGYTEEILLGGTPVMKGLGFRYASDKRGYPYPVGIDGVIETHAPPYMSMDEAVDDVWNMKFKPGFGVYSPDVREGDEKVYTGFSPRPRAVCRPFKDINRYLKTAEPQSVQSVQIAKDFCNYIYDTYGRFPKTIGPIMCGSLTQISHIDVEFYNRYFREGCIWQEQREHLDTWHR